MFGLSRNAFFDQSILVEVVIDCVTRLKKIFLIPFKMWISKFKMNQTENEIQRIMYHPLITFVKRKEEITCSCQQKTCICIHTGVSNVVGFQVATDIFVALA